MFTVRLHLLNGCSSTTVMTEADNVNSSSSSLYCPFSCLRRSPITDWAHEDDYVGTVSPVSKIADSECSLA